MKAIRLLCLTLVLFLAGAVGACALAPPPRPTPPPEPTFPAVRVTADQVARAMQADHFFSDYAQNTLLIQGTISSVSQQQNDLIVELETSVPTKVRCDLGIQSTRVHVGDSITVLSADPQHDASREGAALVLRNCRIL